MKKMKSLREKVYLVSCSHCNRKQQTIQESGRIRCYYCGKKFKLKDAKRLR